MTLVLALIAAYLLGAFPSGIIIARAYGIDIRSQGSGNIGATNLARVVGKKAGALTLGLDAIKGGLAVSLPYLFRLVGFNAGSQFSEAELAFALYLSAVAGHCFSLPPLLRGGKGVATALGGILVLLPLVALASLLVFLLVFTIKRVVSLASLSAAGFACVYASYALGLSIELLLFSGVVVLIALRHSSNIQRLKDGTEQDFKFAEESRAE